jgi:fructose-bisphosphate aldolase class II
VIIATSIKALEYAGIDQLSSIMHKLAQQAIVPIALHLDHSPNLAWIEQALSYGFSSVMLDASHLPFEENVNLTKQAVELCNQAGIPVEAELGQLKGVEDHVRAAEHVFTDPEQAALFVQQTGCSSLAVSIGTSHGAYKLNSNSKLDFDRLKTIREKVSVPLVLHGASSLSPELLEKAAKCGLQLGNPTGIPEQDIRTAISLGVCKVNTDTELRLAFTVAMREFYAKYPGSIDVREAVGYARNAVNEEVKSRIKLLGSAGKA